MKYENEIKTILKSVKSDTDMLNIMEALNFDADKFAQAQEIALEMDNRNLVKMLYANYNAKKVIVEFTLLGKAASHD